jgi:acetylornithine/succinyldiaminopimelate/putrescine aminotransferase
MGQELECKMKYQKRSFAGKAYLETDHILFRGAERVKISLKDVTSVSAKSGWLTLEFVGGPAVLQLGKAAEKWAEKILHPPTRADKLGVKPGLAVRTEGEFDAEFLAELQGTEDAQGKADLVFYLAADGEALGRVAKLAKELKPAGALWVVYPKGVAAIREVEVIERGRAAGLKDVKVASFSATHTALKFVIPVADR